MKIKVMHWRNDNKPERGWYCWVYADNFTSFLVWMKKNMRGKYDATSRFNSGDPMITVWIADDDDATVFKLRWM